MHPGQVVVLHEVLGDELPVRLDRVLDRADEPVLGEPVSVEPRGQVAQLVLELRRRRVEADEDEAAPLRGAGRVEPVIGPCRTPSRPTCRTSPRCSSGNAGLRREQRRPEARPVEVVRPGVVRALEEAFDPSIGSDDELGTAMATHVVVGAQLAGAVPADEDRASGDLGDDEGARSGDLVGDADRDPGGAEDALLLEGMERVGRVGVGDQRRGVVDGEPGRAVRGLLGRRTRAARASPGCRVALT